MDRIIRIGIYRVLRKIGIKRDQIQTQAPIKEKLFDFEQDWNVFLFYVESRFGITINKKDELNIHTLEDSINIVKKRCLN